MQFYSRVMHCIPISSGLTKLSFNSITNQQFSRCHGLLTAKLLNNISISVEPNDYHGRILYLFGTNDPKVQAVAQALLSPGDRFLDIGANYSSIGLLAINSVGCDGQIHLFEPQPHLCQYVEEAIKTAGLTNVYLHKIALMDREDEMQLARPQNHSGMATLVEHLHKDNWDSITVPVKNIAEYVQPLVGSKPFGAKLDVEGAEPYLMPWLLNQSSLKFLIFEAAHNHKKLWGMVESSGLTLYGLRRLVWSKQISKVESLSDIYLYHDLVAIRLPTSVATPQTINPIHLGNLIRNAHAG